MLVARHHEAYQIRILHQRPLCLTLHGRNIRDYIILCELGLAPEIPEIENLDIRIFLIIHDAVNPVGRHTSRLVHINLIRGLGTAVEFSTHSNSISDCKDLIHQKGIARALLQKLLFF